MHIVEPFTELPGVANEAVPELVLPDRPRSVPSAIERTRGNPFDILDRTGNGEGRSGADQSVPVIRHQYVAQEQEVQLPARCLDCCHQLLVFPVGKVSEGPAKVNGDEKDSIRHSQAMDTGHVVILAPGSPAKSHGTETVPWLPVARATPTAQTSCRGYRYLTIRVKSRFRLS
jgi:hypothetical protein